MAKISRRIASITLTGVVTLALSQFPAEALFAAEAAPPANASAAVPTGKELIARLKVGHPRLLVDEAGFAQLQKRIAGDEVLKAWDQAIVEEADKLLDAPLPQHVLPDGIRLLSTSRAVMAHVYTLALVYRLHGDRRHLDRLWREIDTVAAFPDFNPNHFLDTAEMTHALGIAYDWLFDTWTDSQRATIRRAIVERGLKPGLQVYRRGRGWPQSVHNWNQVCNGGLSVGALAIGDEEPELAGDILHSALESVPRAMASYAPDGAWAEGPSYWTYATSYNVLMLAALQSALGTEFGLAETPGFSQTGLFPIYLTSPTGQTFNYSDSGASVGHPECLFWLARRFDLPVCNWFAVNYGQPDARGLIWYQKPTVDPVQAGLPTGKYYRGVEVVSMRSTWNDPGALFVGMQAGSNRVNHNHLDLGSFVLDALGQRWAMDMGGDNYNLPGYWGSQRYEYYRLRAEGHNTLLINPDQNPDQNPDAVTRITRYHSDNNGAIAVADLTPAYASHANRVERGLAMLDRRSVLLQDEIEAAESVTVWWFMHTAAEVALSPDGHTATLTQKGQKLAVRLLAPADAKFEILPAVPLSSSPNPEGQRSNSGIQKLTIHLADAKNLRLAVLFQPLTGDVDTAQQPPIRPLAEW